MGLSSSIFDKAINAIKKDDVDQLEQIINSNYYLKLFPSDVPIVFSINTDLNNRSIKCFTLLDHCALYNAYNSACYLLYKYNINLYYRKCFSLFKNTININEYNIGVTSLHVAIIHGSVEIVKLLVQLGADLNSKIKQEYPIINGKNKNCYELI